MAKRRRKKKNIIASIALAPITIPMKMANGILTVGAVVAAVGLGGIFASAKASGKRRSRYRSNW